MSEADRNILKINQKVIAEGKETYITAISFDEIGELIYTVKGSMKDYYANELKNMEVEQC